MPHDQNRKKHAHADRTCRETDGPNAPFPDKAHPRAQRPEEKDPFDALSFPKGRIAVGNECIHLLFLFQNGCPLRPPNLPRPAVGVANSGAKKTRSRACGNASFTFPDGWFVSFVIILFLKRNCKRPVSPRLFPLSPYTRCTDQRAPRRSRGSPRSSTSRR